MDFFFDIDDFSADGVVSNATASQGDIGRRMMERIVDYGIEFVNIFASMDTRVPRNQFASNNDK